MNILLLEPYYGGSHKQWADALKQYSSHNIEIQGLPSRHWKWRMHGAGVTMAEQFMQLKLKPDLILCSDMLDLSTFQALTRSTSADIPFVVYFHENQLTYPKSSDDTDIIARRDNHYAFINYVSAISADRIVFNSHYHLNDFYQAATKMLKAFPDHNTNSALNEARKRSAVIPVGIDVMDEIKSKDGNDVAHILWNHRWEEDKNPNEFFKVMLKLKDAGSKFKLVVLGKAHDDSPKIFTEASKLFSEEIIMMGYCESRTEYLRWVSMCDFIPVTSNQEFFGVSVLEAIRLGVYPILPNRLSYPEHVPHNLHDKYLYKNPDDLYTLLENLLDQFTSGVKPSIDFTVEKYDWTNVISKYDLMFQEEVKSN